MAVYLEKKRRATFAGMHDATKAYNPYDIVLAEQDYYLSVSPVPVGIPITNDSYWMWYAGANGDAEIELRLEFLENALQDVEVDISDLTDILGDLSDNQGALLDTLVAVSGSVQRVQGEVDRMNGTIALVQSSIAVISGKYDDLLPRIVDLESRMSQVESDIEGLTESVNYAAYDMDNVNRDAINFTKLLIGG